MTFMPFFSNGARACGTPFTPWRQGCLPTSASQGCRGGRPSGPLPDLRRPNSGRALGPRVPGLARPCGPPRRIRPRQRRDIAANHTGRAMVVHRRDLIHSRRPWRSPRPRRPSRIARGLAARHARIRAEPRLSWHAVFPPALVPTMNVETIGVDERGERWSELLFSLQL